MGGAGASDQDILKREEDFPRLGAEDVEPIPSVMEVKRELRRKSPSPEKAAKSLFDFGSPVLQPRLQDQVAEEGEDEPEEEEKKRETRPRIGSEVLHRSFDDSTSDFRSHSFLEGEERKGSIWASIIPSRGKGSTSGLETGRESGEESATSEEEGELGLLSELRESSERVEK